MNYRNYVIAIALSLAPLAASAQSGGGGGIGKGRFDAMPGYDDCVQVVIQAADRVGVLAEKRREANEHSHVILLSGLATDEFARQSFRDLEDLFTTRGCSTAAFDRGFKIYSELMRNKCLWASDHKAPVDACAQDMVDYFAIASATHPFQCPSDSQ